MPAHVWRRAVMLVPAESQWWHERVGEHFAAVEPDALAELGFEPEVVDWPVSRLSSGEKQRLALLRALSVDPEALLLDEPTANLDADSTARVEAWLVGIALDKRLPVLWVAHDRAQIERVAQRHFRVSGDHLERQR
jgi:ATPase subunit of ABC transporter with duplicated ATPase domains